jgi:1-acyl-sn-glycerol-3-phosphate acyltransferase
VVYWLARAVLQPFFHLYFRLSRIGREHVPADGPVIFCANHRSFLDPFIIGTITRRPMYYVAKSELFRHRVIGWFLNALGAFPVNRGQGDRDFLATAKAILERGDSVLMFAEGTRIRPGALGRPKRGVGRLALETGVPVVPVAIIGTEAVRKGILIRPHKVRVRIGSPLRFPRVEHPAPQLAAAVTDRIWPNVMLQWEWLGGLPPLRRAAVIGDGPWATALTAMLGRAGLEVERGWGAGLELARHDLVCFALPPARLPAALAEHGARVPGRAGVLVASHGLVPPQGAMPGAYAAERTPGWATGVLAGPLDPADVLDGAGSLVVAAADPAFRNQVAAALRAARFDVTATADVTGVELAAAAAIAPVRAKVPAARVEG